MNVPYVPGSLAGRRSAAGLVAEARAVVEPAYRRVIDALPTEIRHVAGYHIGWWDADGRPSGSSGKAVRPALTLACARAAGGEVNDRVVAAAVAVELVHDFSLLHDDVMDGDLTRRHRPTAWTVFGTSQAILVGDVLLIAAMEQVSAQSVKVLAAAVQALCAGQSADLAFEERTGVSVAECLAMAEGKTAALMGATCQLGALAAGADFAVTGHYREFGRELGLAFQLIDDLLGIWGDPKITGKPAGADLASRKKSLPVVAALASDSPASEHLAWLYGREQEWDGEAVAHVAGLVEAAGGRSWAQAEADRRINAALSALAAAGPKSDAAADLQTLAALITRRDS